MGITPLSQRFGNSTSSLMRENPWLLSLPSKVRESAVTSKTCGACRFIHKNVGQGFRLPRLRVQGGPRRIRREKNSVSLEPKFSFNYGSDIIYLADGGRALKLSSALPLYRFRILDACGHYSASK